MKLQHWHGEAEVNVGDKFRWAQGDEWEVTAFTNERTYSSSTIGGTPTVRAKCIGDMPAWYAQYQNEDGTVDFCGDSVAAVMSRATSNGSVSNG